MRRMKMTRVTGDTDDGEESEEDDDGRKHPMRDMPEGDIGETPSDRIVPKEKTKSKRVTRNVKHHMFYFLTSVSFCTSVRLYIYQ